MAAGVGVLPFLCTTALADYPGQGAGPTVGCNAGAVGVSFGGTCVAVQGPTAPTQPAYYHPWIKTVPLVAPACVPRLATQWATGTSNSGWSTQGGFWTLAGQRVPILYSTPLEDFGWNWQVLCGSPGTVRFQGVAHLPRSPSPCAPGTPAPKCRPGLDPGGLLASIERQLPTERITASPPDRGLVGVPVAVALDPVPVVEYATINTTAPDLGDRDPGEHLHVVWDVQAEPRATTWTWPDGTSSALVPWVPQVAETGGEIAATVTYAVTASGFWSDGVSLHSLGTVTVGVLTVRAALPYAVQQVQADLG